MAENVNVPVDTYDMYVTPQEELVERVRTTPSALATYLSAYGLFADGVTTGSLDSLIRSLDYIEFMSRSMGLADFPDVALLKMSVKQTLPKNHPLYEPFNYDGLFVCHTNSALIGSLRSTILKNVGAIDVGSIDQRARRALWGDRAPTLTPDTVRPVAVYVAYSGLDAGVDVYDAASARAGWAIVNINAGRYGRAYNAVGTRGETDVSTYIARLCLWFATSRWGDGVDCSDEFLSRSKSSFSITSGSPADHMYAIAMQVALVVGGISALYLGDVPRAKSRLSNVYAGDGTEKSELYPRALTAWGVYGYGMTYRMGEDVSPSKSMEYVSRACAMMSHPLFDAALNEPSLTIPTTSRENIDKRTDFWDKETEPDPEMERKLKQKDMRETYRTRADALLNAQVGMANVKSQIHRMIATISVERERARRGGMVKPTNYNLVLTGPPGTGKSTIVDVLALYFASLGIVDEPEPLVTHRADYVAETVGGSAIKTRATIEKAKGRVLFFDEFYSLVQVADGPNADQFGKEALDTIVAEAETRIGQLVFIIAGYERDIDRVVRINDGLNSRFPRRIEFDTYSLREIADIAVLQAKRGGLVLSNDAYDFLCDENGDVRNVLATTDTGDTLLDVMGNGRFARNLVETATEFQAQRLMDAATDIETMSDDDLRTLTLDDIVRSFDQYLTSSLRHG